MKQLGGILLMGVSLVGLTEISGGWVLFILGAGFFGGLELYVSAKIEEAVTNLEDKV